MQIIRFHAFWARGNRTKDLAENTPTQSIENQFLWFRIKVLCHFIWKIKINFTKVEIQKTKSLDKEVISIHIRICQSHSTPTKTWSKTSLETNSHTRNSIVWVWCRLIRLASLVHLYQQQLIVIGSHFKTKAHRINQHITRCNRRYKITSRV